MERQRWTDDRLDDLVVATRNGFDGVDRRFEEMNRRFEQADRSFERVDRDIRELRQTMLRGGAAMIAMQMVGFLGVIATILVRGA